MSLRNTGGLCGFYEIGGVRATVMYKSHDRLKIMEFLLSCSGRLFVLQYRV